MRQVVAREALPAHKFGHQARLYAISRQVGAELDFDDDVVFAAAWLHDLGVFEGNRPSGLVELEQWDHVRYAVRRSAELLASTDFPAGKIARVITVIEEHQPKDLPTSLEATMVRDADILEQLGAIAIFRVAAKLGSDTRFTRFTDARDYLQRQIRDLPSKLLLPRSRELAVTRQKVLEDFLSNLRLEAGGDLG